MTSNIYNRIMIIYIVKLIRKLNYLNGYSYSAKDIHKCLVNLRIQPRPTKKAIKNILHLSGKIEDKIC